MNYITRAKEGIMVQNKDEVYFQTGLQSFINQLCIQNISTYDGRKLAAKRLLNTRAKVPIYVSDSILLLFTHSIRNQNCCAINFHQVMSYKKVDLKTKITFYDFSYLWTDVSETIIDNQMKKCVRLLERIIDN